jgi:hypothetical protein
MYLAALLDDSRTDKNKYPLKSNINMDLAALADNTRTDKNTTHFYLQLYESLLHWRRTTANHVLEIGIGPSGTKNGGSIRLWHDYFYVAQIYALDIIPRTDIWPELFSSDRITVFASTDAYDVDFVKLHLAHVRFDMVLDDGPHTLESMIMFIHLYLPLLSDTGILIIEDVQSIEWIDYLKAAVPTEYSKYIQVYDLRHVKNRYDDLVFAIDKSQKGVGSSRS